jgi:hypothetical protein
MTVWFLILIEWIVLVVLVAAAEFALGRRLGS